MLFGNNLVEEMHIWIIQERLGFFCSCLSEKSLLSNDF